MHGLRDAMSSVLVGALVAGAVAIGVTVAIERFGGRLGGVLGSLPTTIVPASYGFAALSDHALRDALCGVPAGMVVNALFLWLWRVLPPRLPPGSVARRLATMIVATLSAWLVAATAMVLGTAALAARGVPVPLTGAALTLLLVTVGVAACRRLPDAPRGHRRVHPIALLSRGVLAAGAIAVAITLAHVAGPVVGGVASVFPAIFLTAMVSLWASQGEAVQAGAVGPILLGSSSVCAYSLTAAVFIPAMGFAAGAALSWGLAVLVVSLPAAVFLTRRGGGPSA